MISTRPNPSWLEDGYSTRTYLEKKVIVRYGPVNALPVNSYGVFLARASTQLVPSTVWTR